MENNKTKDINLPPKKISSESFKTKFKKLKSKHNTVLLSFKEKHKKELLAATNRQEVRISKKSYKKKKRIEENRFALTYNALKNQELYRRGAKEANIAKEKLRFNKRRDERADFDLESEKKKLVNKIKNIEIKYSMPISSTLRKNRIAKTDDQLQFIKVPLQTPFKKNLKSLFWLMIAAIISTLAIDTFIKPFGIYNAGLRGITQSIYYVIRYQNKATPTWVSYLLFLAFNIPLAIFGYKKVGKKFTFYTMFYLVIQYLFSLTLDQSGLKDSIKPFGKTAKEFADIYVNGSVQGVALNYAIPLLSSSIGGILYGTAIGIVYKAGASGGGSKFVVTYYSMTKDKSIGKLAMYFSIFVVTFGLIVNRVIVNGENFITSFSSIILFGTIFFVFLSNTAIDAIFSKNKKELVSVITNKKEALLRFLDVKLMYNRTFTVSKVETSFEKNTKHKIEFLVSATETNTLVNICSSLDNNAYINVVQVNKIAGKFYSSWFE